MTTHRKPHARRKAKPATDPLSARLRDLAASASPAVAAWLKAMAIAAETAPKK